MSRIDAIAARQRLVDDRYYYLRGCAPDEEDPRMSAGDPDVPVDAWGPYTDDGAEAQRDRLAREKAALAICGRCPVLALCRVYANTTTVDETGVEHLVEPEGILGGELALTRHRALIARRHAATVGETTAATPASVPARTLDDARTPQKRAVLAALARETDPDAVAYRAGMDLRTANWHRSALVGMLGLDREHATRDQLLAAAVETGLLPRSTRIRPDGPMPYAAAPTVDGVRQRRIAPPTRTVGPQLLLPGMEDMPRGPRRLAGPTHPHLAHRVATGRAPAAVVKPRRTLRTRIRAAVEQLLLPFTAATTPALVPEPAPAYPRSIRAPRPRRTAPTPSTVLEPAA
ncbi:hypothetical protein ACFW9I_03025 [[Kitasatospora] papulosa]|uniref:hypothetical protein n=1 Tax=[Kitasatospora] papulosa TaxID=1464011 RepID=UPI0036B31460